MTVYRDTGLAYCVAHDGIVDVDQDQFDFGRHALPEDQADCDLRPLVYAEEVDRD